MAAAAAAADLFRTRNGRLKACEPCRRRKVACDHSLPICNQCIHRKAPQYCVYIFPRAAASSNPNPHLTSAAISDVLNLSESSAADGGDVDAPTPRSPIRKPVDQFWGPTSFLAAFGHPSPGTTLEALGQPPRETAISSGDPLDAFPSEGFSITPALFALASKVLTQFPDERTCLLLFDRYHNQNDEILRPALDRVLKSFWFLYGEELRLGKASSIRQIATVISQNTSLALEDDQDGLERWMRSSSLQSIRWEGLGIILSHLSYGIISSGGEDSFLVEQQGSEKDRERILKEMRECVANCIALSREYTGNTLLAYLIYKHMILEGIVNGDTSPSVWMLHGELISTVTSIGMHIEVAGPQPRSNLSIEVRRRVFSSIFIMDKILATFTGRPPLLSHRFTSTPPPLDISDEALLAGDHSSLAAAARAARLNVNGGWSPNGTFNPSAMLRARRLIAVFRSEILDEALALSSPGGVNPRADMIGNPSSLVYHDNTSGTYQALLQLRERCKEFYSTLPPFLVHRLEDYAGRSEKPVSENFARYNLRLEYLHSMYLLEQLISQYELSSAGQGLFDIAREMLSLVLLFWNQRERLIEASNGVSWMILNFAVPASGTLCAELLRQSRSASSSSSQQPHRPYAWIPRSETIQNLRMLVTFLDWVPLSAPNADICQRLRHQISRLLDELLDPYAQTPTTSASTAPTSTSIFNAASGGQPTTMIPPPELGTNPFDMYNYEDLVDLVAFDSVEDLNSVAFFNWIT